MPLSSPTTLARLASPDTTHLRSNGTGFGYWLLASILVVSIQWNTSGTRSTCHHVSWAEKSPTSSISFSSTYVRRQTQIKSWNSSSEYSTEANAPIMPAMGRTEARPGDKPVCSLRTRHASSAFSYLWTQMLSKISIYQGIFIHNVNYRLDCL